MGVKGDAGRVVLAAVSSRSGLFAVGAKVFIDCTGDGSLSALAGASFEKGDSDGWMMAGSLCSLWAG
jgi:hypothetical protein